MNKTFFFVIQPVILPVIKLIGKFCFVSSVSILQICKVPNQIYRKRTQRLPLINRRWERNDNNNFKCIMINKVVMKAQCLILNDLLRKVQMLRNFQHKTHLTVIGKLANLNHFGTFSIMTYNEYWQVIALDHINTMSTQVCIDRQVLEIQFLTKGRALCAVRQRK